MGKIRISRIVYWAAGIGAIATSCAVVAAAQSSGPRLSSAALSSPPRISLEALAPQSTTAVIDFENVQGPQSGAGIELTNQYANRYGITFARGVSVHQCFDSEFTATTAAASLCPYPQAASGQRAALFDVRSGGPELSISFAKPVSSVSMKINPTGGTPDEVFIAEIKGFDLNENVVVSEIVEFNWFQDAFTWPTSIAFKTDGGRLVRATLQLKRASDASQPVRFLFDDLSIQYAADLSDTPVLAALAERHAPPLIRQASAAQSENRTNDDERLRRYKAATRLLAPIDWEAAEETLGEQNSRNMRPARARLDTARNRVQLPVLLPAQIDANTLSVVGGDNSYHADFAVGNRAYSVYGTRELTLVSPARGAPKPELNLTEIETEYAFVVSFSLFGASYTLTRYCKNDNAAEDPGCYDRSAMGEVLKDIILEVGEAGKRRP